MEFRPMRRHRQQLPFASCVDILRRNIERSGNMDKTTVLTGSYYENFDAVRAYVRGVIEHDRQ